MATPASKPPQSSQVPKAPATFVRTQQRVINATLFFKAALNHDSWTALEPTYNRGRGQETVRDVTFNGGIEICQSGDPDAVDGKFIWKIRFEPFQYDSNAVHVDEFLREGLTTKFIAVQFKPLAAPSGSAGKVTIAQHTKQSGPSSASAPPPPPSAQDEAASFLDPPRPDEFPLARLSQNFTEDGYTALLLVFYRNEKKMSGPTAWSWPATLAFLAGQPTWTAPPQKAETVRLDKLALVDYLAEPICQAASHVPRPANRGFWLVPRSTKGSLLPDVADLPATALKISDPDVFEAELRELKRKRLQEDLQRLEDIQAVLPDKIREKRQKLADLLEEKKEEEGRVSE